MKSIVFFILSLILTLSVKAAERVNFNRDTMTVYADSSSFAILKANQAELKQPKHKKLKAALLALLLGPFGVHRIYLGTATNVPVVYSLTLGGGLGVLPLIDFFHIVFSKDLSKFEDNKKVFMWDSK